MEYASLPDYLAAALGKVGEWTPDRLRAVAYLPDSDPRTRFYPDKPDIARRAATAWFRGQDEPKPLLPKVLRPPPRDEREMNFDLRRKAALRPEAPDWDDYPQWLFLMQHHGLPTRLLDWTESACAALYFAIRSWSDYKRWRRWEWFKPRVWMMNPYAFNWALVKCSVTLGTGDDERQGNDATGYVAFGRKNINGAFGVQSADKDPSIQPHDKPMAIMPVYAHDRMQVQQSRFTVHGNDPRPIEDHLAGTDAVEKGFFAHFDFVPDAAPKLLAELQLAGTTESTLFPDLEGIARELAVRFGS